jgi:hypothetical protein
VARSATLGKYLNPKNQQRLSVDNIHALWNAEEHRAAGRIPYQRKIDQAAIKKDPHNGALLGAAMMEMLDRHKWQDEAGNLYEHDPISSDLIELIRKGDLRAFRSGIPEATPVAVDELAGIEIKSAEYFIDRDDLGCFLVARGHSLPRFWYEPEDVSEYENRLSKQTESFINLRDHHKALIEENESLKQEMLDARPFMNPEHPHFSPELEATVQLWLELFSQKPADARVAQKPAMESWLTTHRPEAFKSKGGHSSSNALARIVSVANPRKEGGRPRKSKLF